MTLVSRFQLQELRKIAQLTHLNYLSLVMSDQCRSLSRISVLCGANELSVVICDRQNQTVKVLCLEASSAYVVEHELKDHMEDCYWLFVTCGETLSIMGDLDESSRTS